MRLSDYVTLMGVLMATAGLARYRQTIAEALAKAFDDFRGGGPQPPVHPLPANDAKLLRRKLFRG